MSSIESAKGLLLLTVHVKLAFKGILQVKYHRNTRNNGIKPKNIHTLTPQRLKPSGISDDDDAHWALFDISGDYAVEQGPKQKIWRI